MIQSAAYATNARPADMAIFRSAHEDALRKILSGKATNEETKDGAAARTLFILI